jgi:hypothetical protein
MILEPLEDEGQILPQLRGMLIGVLDARQELDAAVAAINAAGIPISEMVVLHGEDGLNLIERFQSGSSYFSDGPEKLFRRDKSVLAEGKYILGISVKSSEQARELAALAKQHGGHGFAHFGMFVDILLN